MLNEPKRKITIVLEPIEPAPEPEPKRCDLCLEIAPDWEFGDTAGRIPGVMICGNCHPRSHRFPVGLTGLSDGSLAWCDVEFLWRAQGVLRAILNEVNTCKKQRSP